MRFFAWDGYLSTNIGLAPSIASFFGGMDSTMGRPWCAGIGTPSFLAGAYLAFFSCSICCFLFGSVLASGDRWAFSFEVSGAWQSVQSGAKYRWRTYRHSSDAALSGVTQLAWKTWKSPPPHVRLRTTSTFPLTEGGSSAPSVRGSEEVPRHQSKGCATW